MVISVNDIRVVFSEFYFCVIVCTYANKLRNVTVSFNVTSLIVSDENHMKLINLLSYSISTNHRVFNNDTDETRMRCKYSQKFLQHVMSDVKCVLWPFLSNSQLQSIGMISSQL